AVAVPDRERVTALLGVLDAAELTPDMHVAVEHDLTAIDPDEALLLLRVLARLDDERPGHADECRLTPHEGVRVFDGRDDRRGRECADHQSGGEDAPVAARQEREVERDDAADHPVLPFVPLDPQRQVLGEGAPLLGADERCGPRPRPRADAWFPAAEMTPDTIRALLDEATARLACLALGCTIVSLRRARGVVQVWVGHLGSL